MSIATFLATVRGFKTLTPAQLEVTAGRMREAHYEPGAPILRRGEPGDSMHIVRSGEVRIPVFDNTGRIRLIARLGPGEVFGEMALLTGERRRADVTAEGAVTTVVVDRETITPLLTEHPPLARFLTEILGQRLEEAGGVERVGKYRLLGKIGEGATAKVYEALHPHLNRTVAMKMLGHHLVYDVNFRDRFLNEARTIAGLVHPNIVQIFDTEQAFATWFLVMEKVEGGSLADLLARDGALAADHACEILRQVAGALRFAHARGIVHRDVKPANTAVDDDGVVKLMDFGIAERFGAEGERRTAVEGTPRYLAPETILGAPADGRADIYALGVMAFEMVVGRPPFIATDIEGMLRAHVSSPVPDLGRLLPDLPSGLRAFIDGALQKDPGRRLVDWGRIDALLAGGERASHALDRFEEVVVRVRYRPESRESVDRAVEGLRRRVQTIPWVDVASARLGAEVAAAGEEAPKKGWFSRLGLVTGGDSGEAVVHTRAMEPLDD